MKKKFGWLVSFLFLALFFSSWSWAGSATSLSITGAVRHPLHLTMEDIGRYQTVETQLNEVTKDGTFKGAFNYRGVPLQILLKLAGIQKEDIDFPKLVDLAILVRNQEGSQVVLSWGEVFYRNPADIIIGLKADPIIPHKKQYSHSDQLNRLVGLPKLVIVNDFYTDRCLEGVTSIEVMDLHLKIAGEKSAKLNSSEFIITGEIKKPVAINDLSLYPRKEKHLKVVGEGRGYHGIKKYGGASLQRILDEKGMNLDLNTVFIISAPDGYRSLLSYGEIFMNSCGEQIMISDRLNDKVIKEGGKFTLVLPGDLMADRGVKSVQKIEVMSLRQKPKLYIIGTGCGDTNLITLEAISYLAKADAFVCPPDLKKRFAKYMGNKPILFDLYEFVPPVLKKKNPDLSAEELKKLLEKKRTWAAGIIRDTLDKNKTVAIMEYADPTIWSGCRSLSSYFDKKTIEIIPGLSAFNVANALIEKRIGCNGSIVIATSRGLLGNQDMVKVLAKNGETLAIFMGLRQIKSLVSLLKEYYPGNTPVNLVYKAGYSGHERVIKDKLDGLFKILEREPEKLLVMIYLGPCLSDEAKLYSPVK